MASSMDTCSVTITHLWFRGPKTSLMTELGKYVQGKQSSLCWWYRYDTNTTQVEKWSSFFPSAQFCRSSHRCWEVQSAVSVTLRSGSKSWVTTATTGTAVVSRCWIHLWIWATSTRISTQTSNSRALEIFASTAGHRTLVKATSRWAAWI